MIRTGDKSKYIIISFFFFLFFMSFYKLNVFAEENLETATDSDAYYDLTEEEKIEIIIEEQNSEIVSDTAGPVTVYDGIDYSAVYDYNYYISKYPDVKNAYGEDSYAALKHFVNNGMNEGRQAKESFNVYSYAYRYADIRRVCKNNLKSYYMHYITNGSRENRVAIGTGEIQNPATVYGGIDYSKVYDYKYYTDKYPDIKNTYGLDDEGALGHFVNNGMNEGRQANESFNVYSYAYRYADIRRACKNDLKSYYMHYITNGSKENRVAIGTNEIQNPATVYNGINYSKVYDYEYYTSRYPEIKSRYDLDDMGILENFVNEGMDKGLQAKADFDVWSYGYSYRDLRNVLGSKPKNYYMHYINNGSNENRTLTYGVTNSNNELTVYADYDFSGIYDIVYYTSHNPDVRSLYGFDEKAILEHFAKNGLRENRVAAESYSVEKYNEAKEKMNEYFKTTYKEEKYPKAVYVLNVIGWDLKSAFDWSSGLKYYSGVSKSPDPGINYFGDFGFDNGKGNCYVMAAVFYEMAYVMGYEVRQMAGEVPLRNGGSGPHSWVEIDMEGETYVFDPDFTNETKQDGFKLKYGQSGTWIYKNISVMHE
ncbi:MAG: transglutaminase domain-containing protein [Lachnospiraceae bacterium]|nr:transglutaminase domain-containing protein [Lachnospiraceae bacterium]